MTTTQYINAHSYFDERKAKYAYKTRHWERRFFLNHGYCYTGMIDDFWGFY